MLDRAIIDHASPTLARLKLGSLFNHTMGEDFPAEFAALNGQLMDRGVTMTVLRVAGGQGADLPLPGGGTEKYACG